MTGTLAAVRTWLAVALVALSAVSLVICVYFVTLFYSVPAWLARLMGRTMKACGVDGGSCARVVKTSDARLLAGHPNVVAGLPWSVAGIALGIAFLATGAVPFWEVAFAVALASVALGVYLTWSLLWKLKDP